MSSPSCRLASTALVLLALLVPAHSEGGSHTARPGRKTKPGSHRWEHWWAREGEYLLVQRQDTPAPTALDGATRRACLAALRDALDDDAPQIRKAAVVGLGKGAHHDDSARLWRRASKDRAVSVREAALLGVGLSGRSNDVERLAQIMNDRRMPRSVRAAAALGLGLHGAPAARRVLEDRIGGASSRALRPREERHTALAAGAGLAMLGDAGSADVLAKTLRTRKLPGPFAARLVSALGRIDGARHAAQIRERLTSKAVVERRAAAAALSAGPPDEASVRALVTVLREDQDAATRGLAALSLARSRHPIARAAIHRAHRSADSRVRPYATIALALAGLPVHDVLVEQLKSDTDPSRLAACALAMGLLRKRESALSLGVVADFTGCPAQRGMTCLALGMVDASEAFPLVSSLLHRTPDRTPRLNATRALALLDRERTGRDLRRMLDKSSTANPATREIALQSIGRLRLSSGVRLALRIATDPREPDATRAAALYAMGCLLEDGIPARVHASRGWHERLDDDPLERLLPLL